MFRGYLYILLNNEENNKKCANKLYSEPWELKMCYDVEREVHTYEEATSKITWPDPSGVLWTSTNNSCHLSIGLSHEEQSQEIWDAILFANYNYNKGFQQTLLSKATYIG